MIQEPAGKGIDWTLVILAAIGLVQIVALELLRRTHKAVNSTASALKVVADANAGENVTLKTDKAVLQERLIARGQDSDPMSPAPHMPNKEST